MQRLFTFTRRMLAAASICLAASPAFSQVVKPNPQIAVNPRPEHAGSFTMVLVPDPQSYTKFTGNQPLFDLQTAWIAENIDNLNIMAALVTGDMVEQNNKLTNLGVPHPHNGNLTSRQQWEGASHAFSYLDGKLPYILAQGNHDVGTVAAESRHSMQPEFFYPERNPAWETCLVATAPDWRGIHTMENAAYEFAAPAWGRILVIAFEFAPRDETLDWARSLIESERFRNDRVIILTHSMLHADNRFVESERYQLTPRNWPRQVWDKLIAPSKNIDLVLCGHTGTPPAVPGNPTGLSDIDYGSNSAFRIEPAADGRPVPVMMFNSQTGDGEWNGNGGDCWLRLLEFLPDGETISVRTFSPLFAQSKVTGHLAWRDSPDYRFTFKVHRNSAE